MAEDGELVGDLIDLISKELALPDLVHSRLVSKRWLEAYHKCLRHRRRSFQRAALANEVRWEKLGDGASVPYRISVGHCQHPLKPLSFVLFGGEDPKNNLFFNDTCIYDASLNTFTTLTTTGSLPEPRGFPRIHVVKLEGFWNVLLFGGQSRDQEGEWSFYNDVWVLNLETPTEQNGELVYQWQEIKSTSDQVPEARVGHRTCVLGRKMWVFGGCFVKENAYTHFNDVWSYDIFDHTWNNIDLSSGELPSARHSPSLSVLDSHTFSISTGSVVHGNNCTDVWLFDTDKKEFAKTRIHIPKEASRDWFGMDSYALSPRQILLLSTEPTICDLAANTAMVIPRATHLYTARNMLKGYDFCILWSERAVLLLRSPTAPWPFTESADKEQPDVDTVSFFNQLLAVLEAGTSGNL